MNIYDYDILSYINQRGYDNQRNIAKESGYSLGRVNKSLNKLMELSYLNNDFKLTNKARELIQENRPKNAIILAAGFGMRMVPINAELPKGLLTVYGEPLIERLINQLKEAGIYNIDIVVGFLKEKYEYLIDKYGVNLIYNPDYSIKNNLHSLKLAKKGISNTYIIPSDVWSKKNPFSKVELYSWYSVTDESSKDSKLRINRKKELVSTSKGEYGNTIIGISYICSRDKEKFCKNIDELTSNSNMDGNFWEEALFNGEKKIQVYSRQLKSEEVFELNTYEQLRELDDCSNSLETDTLKLISEVMKVEIGDIKDIEVLKKGMTNRSFMFSVKGNKYIMRIPGEGTDKLINRSHEYDVYGEIGKFNFSDELVYISKDNGYKITKFIEDSRECDPYNFNDVRECMKLLKKLHKKKLSVEHDFDIFERIEFYESLWGRNISIFDDYKNTKEKILNLIPIIDELPKEWALTHIDAVPDNFLFAGDVVRLIDWEYASMQDPHLDIAMFAIYAMYDRENIDKLIDIYFVGNCDIKVRIKIYAYIAACGLLWSNWCEYKRFCGVEFGEYSLRQYRYAKEYYSIAVEEYKKIQRNI